MFQKMEGEKLRLFIEYLKGILGLSAMRRGFCAYTLINTCLMAIKKDKGPSIFTLNNDTVKKE